LPQAEKHHELHLKNAHQYPPGSASLPEVHYNAHTPTGNKNNFKENNLSKSSAGKRKFNNRHKFFMRGKGGKDNGKAPPPRGNSHVNCTQCGSNNHITKIVVAQTPCSSISKFPQEAKV
jgi:hypothetical protein